VPHGRSRPSADTSKQALQNKPIVKAWKPKSSVIEAYQRQVQQQILQEKQKKKNDKLFHPPVSQKLSSERSKSTNRSREVKYGVNDSRNIHKGNNPNKVNSSARGSNVNQTNSARRVTPPRNNFAPQQVSTTPPRSSFAVTVRPAQGNHALP
jgi:hypothetical protein